MDLSGSSYFQRVLVNMGKSTGWGLFSTSWLADPNKAFWSMVIVTVWQLSGYMMLIYIAGFQGAVHRCTRGSQHRWGNRSPENEEHYLTADGAVVCYLPVSYLIESVHGL